MPNGPFNAGSEPGLDRPAPAEADYEAARESLKRVMADAFLHSLKLSWPRRIFIGIFGIPLGIAQTVMAVVLLVSEPTETDSLGTYALVVGLAFLGIFISIYALGCLVTGLDFYRAVTSPFSPGVRNRLVGLTLTASVLLSAGLLALAKALHGWDKPPVTESDAGTFWLSLLKWILIAGSAISTLIALIYIGKTKNVLSKYGLLENQTDPKAKD